MSDYTTRSSPPPVDDAWFEDWVGEGLAAVERYLAKHAAFAAFLAARRLVDSDDGDRVVAP